MSHEIDPGLQGSTAELEPRPALYERLTDLRERVEAGNEKLQQRPCEVNIKRGELPAERVVLGTYPENGDSAWMSMQVTTARDDYGNYQERYWLRAWQDGSVEVMRGPYDTAVSPRMAHEREVQDFHSIIDAIDSTSS